MNGAIQHPICAARWASSRKYCVFRSASSAALVLRHVGQRRRVKAGKGCGLSINRSIAPRAKEALSTTRTIGGRGADIIAILVVRALGDNRRDSRSRVGQDAYGA